jgi:hypothetical protein
MAQTTAFKQNKFFGAISDMVAESEVGLGARIVAKLEMDSDAEMLLNLSGLRCFFVPFGGDNGGPIWAVHKSDPRLRAESDFMPKARVFTLPLTATYDQWLEAIGDYIDARRDEEEVVEHV